MVFQEGIDDLKKITWKLLVKILHSSAFSSLRKSHETFNFLCVLSLSCAKKIYVINKVKLKNYRYEFVVKNKNIYLNWILLHLLLSREAPFEITLCQKMHV